MKHPVQSTSNWKIVEVLIPGNLGNIFSMFIGTGVEEGYRESHSRNEIWCPLSPRLQRLVKV